MRRARIGGVTLLVLALLGVWPAPSRAETPLRISQETVILEYSQGNLRVYDLVQVANLTTTPVNGVRLPLIAGHVRLLPQNGTPKPQVAGDTASFPVAVPAGGRLSLSFSYEVPGSLPLSVARQTTLAIDRLNVLASADKMEVSGLGPASRSKVGEFTFRQYVLTGVEGSVRFTVEPAPGLGKQWLRQLDKLVTPPVLWAAGAILFGAVLVVAALRERRAGGGE